MAETQHAQRFAEIEKLTTDYFNSNIAPIINSQYERAMLMSLGDEGQAWNKTVEFSAQELSSSKNVGHDMAILAGEFREALLNEIGREAYDQASQAVGDDLANFYMDTRIEQLMLNKMKQDKAPHSSLEYVSKKAYNESLLGLLTGGLTKSAASYDVEKMLDKQYSPSIVEKGLAYAGALASDIAFTGGAASWANVGTFVGWDVATRVGAKAYEALSPSEKIEYKAKTAEEVLSRYVFGTSENVFEEFRNEGMKIDPYTDAYINEVNAKLKKSTYSGFSYMQNGGATPYWSQQGLTPDEEFARDQMAKIGVDLDKKEQLSAGDVDPTSGVVVPAMLLPEYLEEYVTEHTLDASKEYAEKHNNEVAMAPTATQATQLPQDENGSQLEDIVTQGWSGFLKKFGLDGLGEMFGNHIGTTIAMLPDAIIGFFKGKNTNFTGQNSIVPMASILAGMFVRNPLLKAVLIGGGGLNLLNKAGHEGLDKAGVSHEQREVQYKKYEDQALDKRVKSPRIVGNVFTADIDGVPRVVQLSQKVIDAYNAGALPINTLANTILARQDALTATVSQNYEEQQRQEQQTLLRR